MIKEAYVSFEVAKILKERGFVESCYGRYSVRSKEFNLDTTRPCNNGGNFLYCAPTQQMAMAWLREEYKIFIEIGVSIDLNGKYHYSYNVLDSSIKYLRRGYTDFDWNYEDAVEEALKYVLNDVI